MSFLLGGRRTALQRRRGPLSELHAAETLGLVTAAALDACGVNPADVDQVITGCVTKVGDQANNVGRSAWLSAGLPQEIPSITIDAKCGSSQQAAHYAAALIRSGAADVVVCNGIEIMTNHPLGEDAGNADLYPQIYKDLYEVTTQGEAAERIARKWGIDRLQCDEIALASQERAAAAIAAGRFADEVVEIGGTSIDNAPRQSTLESLSELKPVFGADGVLTAGNSSQIVDGASCIIVCSQEYLARTRTKPLARFVQETILGVDPVLKLTGPIPATQAALKASGVTTDQLSVVEVNEAFASVLGAWLAEIPVPLERVNQDGGAIALGHPVGATGARLLLTAGRQLRDGSGSHALVAMCCGGGLGTATILGAV